MTTLFLWKKIRLSEEDKKLVEYFQNVFGCTPGKLDLYKIACTHRSVSGRNHIAGVINNERLEYLGDAVLGAIIAGFLFKKYPLEPEGILTEMRSKLVSRKRLNKLSYKIGLHNIIHIDPHTMAKSADGDAFEAVVGAIFLDKGFDKTKKIILNNIFLTHLDIDAIFVEEDNYKSKVLSWAQKNHKKIEFNHSEENDGKQKLYKSVVCVENAAMGDGIGRTMKQADQEAAEHAWQKISENLENHEKKE